MSSQRKRSTTTTTPSTGPVTSNFRPVVEKGRWAAKGTGTAPLPGPTSVSEIFTKVIIHGCRKILFADPKLRLMAYGVMLFFFSLVSDYMSFPPTYFSRKDNFLNVYFVKFSWAWTFVTSGLFMYLTSATISCGNRQRILSHMSRLLIGTLLWFLWTGFFVMIEEGSGHCTLKDETVLYSVKGRRSCFSKNGRWSSFDISGHSFLLVWCVFFMTEEAKAIIGWDGIKDLIRNEEYYRNKISQGGSTEVPPETSLNALTDEEFMQLRTLYNVYDIPAKIALMSMTLLCLIWDFMLLMTAIYFHVMIEKVLGGAAGVVTWIVMYRGLYKLISKIGLPGQGLFKYNFETRKPASSPSSSKSIPRLTSSLSNKDKASASTTGSSARQRTAPDDTPKFMGMPLYALKNAKKEAASHVSLEKIGNR